LARSQRIRRGPNRKQIISAVSMAQPVRKVMYRNRLKAMKFCPKGERRWNNIKNFVL